MTEAKNKTDQKKSQKVKNRRGNTKVMMMMKLMQTQARNHAWFRMQTAVPAPVMNALQAAERLASQEMLTHRVLQLNPEVCVCIQLRLVTYGANFMSD